MISPAPAKMAHRSWYLRADLAERLAGAVDEIHWRVRRPKHEVLGAAIEVALAHQDEVLARLRDGGK